MGKSILISDFQVPKNLGTVTLAGSVPSLSLSVVGAAVVSGSYRAAQYSVKFFPASSTDRAVDWSITSGSQYASINSQGELSVYHGANGSSVTVKAELHSDSTIFATKNITVSFPALPSEYQDVEYLQGDGNAYIDLGFKANLASDGMLLKCQIAEGDRFFSGSNNNSSTRMYFSNSGSKSAAGYARCAVYTKDFYSTTKNCDDGLPHVFEFDGSARKFFFDGEMLADEYPTYNADTYGNVWLFGTSTNGAFPMKIYAYMHFRYGEIYANCVPCYRKADDVPGMYDLVSGTFFTNSGTGTFTCGSDIE